MMKTQKHLKLTVVAVLLGALLGGCSSERLAIADDSGLTVENQNSAKVKILWTDIYQQDGEFFASGILKQSSLSTASIKTHVDVQIVGSDGTIQYETMTANLVVPPNTAGKGLSWKRFKVQLPGELPKDSKINVIVHSAVHDRT